MTRFQGRRRDRAGAGTPARALPAAGNRLPVRPLRIRIRGSSFEGHPETRDYAEQRALSMLGHLSRRVECMAITGETIDRGSERGAIRAQVWARLTCGRQLREEGTGVDPYAAIDRATEALARDVEYIDWRFPPDGALRCA